MKYVERVLQSGENIEFLSRLHWIVYWPGIILIVAAIIALIMRIPERTDFVTPVSLGIVFAMGSIILIHAWIRRWTAEIAVTNKRVIYKRGFIRRHTIEMNMDKIESVDVDQSILGRILDYGTITIHGTGTGIEPLSQIDSPIEFRNSVTAR